MQAGGQCRGMPTCRSRLEQLTAACPRSGELGALSQPTKGASLPAALPSFAQAKRAASAEGFDIPAIPITVRQLEAVIRIAESLAKMQLQVGPPAGELAREAARGSRA